MLLEGAFEPNECLIFIAEASVDDGEVIGRDIAALRLLVQLTKRPERCFTSACVLYWLSSEPLIVGSPCAWGAGKMLLPSNFSQSESTALMLAVRP